MNYIYVLMGGIFWRIWSKKIVLWYVHRQRSFGLYMAEKIVNKIASASPHGFRIKSKKVAFVGHGIDTKKFSCLTKELGETLNILHVGRITEIKNCDTLVKALPILQEKINKDILLRFIGPAETPSDKIYKKELQELIDRTCAKSDIVFAGSISNVELGGEYCSCDIVVNLTPTGGLDKVVFESLAAMRPVFLSNTAFAPIFGEYAETFLFSFEDASNLADKIASYLLRDDKEIILRKLSNVVREKYDLKGVIDKVVKLFV